MLCTKEMHYSLQLCALKHISHNPPEGKGEGGGGWRGQGDPFSHLPPLLRRRGWRGQGDPCSHLPPLLRRGGWRGQGDPFQG